MASVFRILAVPVFVLALGACGGDGAVSTKHAGSASSSYDAGGPGHDDGGDVPADATVGAPVAEAGSSDGSPGIVDAPAPGADAAFGPPDQPWVYNIVKPGRLHHDQQLLVAGSGRRSHDHHEGVLSTLAEGLERDGLFETRNALDAWMPSTGRGYRLNFDIFGELQTVRSRFSVDKPSAWVRRRSHDHHEGVLSPLRRRLRLSSTCSPKCRGRPTSRSWSAGTARPASASALR